MTAADTFAKAGQKALATTVGILAAKVALVLGLAVALYATGRRQGRTAAQAEQLKHQLTATATTLDTLNKALARGQHLLDSSVKVAHSAVQSSQDALGATRKLLPKVQVPPKDSGAVASLVVDTSTIQANEGDTVRVVVPAQVADLMRQLIAEREADSLAITRLLSTEDALLAQNKLLRQIDSVHTVREDLLTTYSAVVEKQGFWRGVRTSMVVGGAVALAAAIVHFVP